MSLYQVRGESCRGRAVAPRPARARGGPLPGAAPLSKSVPSCARAVARARCVALARRPHSGAWPLSPVRARRVPGAFPAPAPRKLGASAVLRARAIRRALRAPAPGGLPSWPGSLGVRGRSSSGRGVAPPSVPGLPRPLPRRLLRAVGAAPVWAFRGGPVPVWSPSPRRRLNGSASSPPLVGGAVGASLGIAWGLPPPPWGPGSLPGPSRPLFGRWAAGARVRGARCRPLSRFPSVPSGPGAGASRVALVRVRLGLFPRRGAGSACGSRRRARSRAQARGLRAVAHRPPMIARASQVAAARAARCRPPCNRGPCVLPCNQGERRSPLPHCGASWTYSYLFSKTRHNIFVPCQKRKKPAYHTGLRAIGITKDYAEKLVHFVNRQARPSSGILIYNGGLVV